MVAAARNLAELEQRRGNSAQAIELEISALNVELELESLSAIFDGPIPAALARVCHYSNASRRILELGNINVATVIAKIAVNELQNVRRRVQQLPQRLQTCFRDIIADHYRWLADLFIRQNRAPEAERVLNMLKNFETFEFVGRDPRFPGGAFDNLPLFEPEEQVRQAIDLVVPPVANIALRERQLQMKRRDLTLSGLETEELQRISAQLAEYTRRTTDTVRVLLAAATRSGDIENVTRLNLLKSIQTYLRDELEANAVAIHFVVLPSRMHAILTLPFGPQITHTWESLNGGPFPRPFWTK